MQNIAERYFSLHNRRAVVTGAGRGIGRPACDAFICYHLEKQNRAIVISILRIGESLPSELLSDNIRFTLHFFLQAILEELFGKLPPSARRLSARRNPERVFSPSLSTNLAGLDRLGFSELLPPYLQ